jgi:DNA-binding Xre family transcriptional regulator
MLGHTKTPHIEVTIQGPGIEPRLLNLPVNETSALVLKMLNEIAIRPAEASPKSTDDTSTDGGQSVPVDAFIAAVDAAPNRAGRMLAARRWQRQLKQKELAEITHIRAAHLSAMERGKRPIGKQAAQRLAKALGCEWRELVSE